ncbi:ADP-ribosyltransferase [Bacillus xiapuensis]|uniref:ADP-ribosyltransferase n=1 Tax=Bacillus xiapuensis TaxID=2014075 RepID=UPI000C23FA25|nr:ADP-ribosyltransferase [Bacillus xiapuensis]
MKNLQVGKTFTDYGFVSTNPLKDSTFIEGSKTLMHIHVPAGTNCAYIDPISEYPGEEEVLLDKGTTFKIKEIIDDNNFICEVVEKMSKDEKDQVKTDSKALNTNDKQNNKAETSKRDDRFTWQEDDVVFD